MGLLDIFGGVSSLAGLLGAQSATRRREAERQQLLDNMRRDAEANYLADTGQNAHDVYAATGVGGNAIRALGQGLGSNLAASGVYNPSSVGGALALGTQQTGANIANLSAQLTAGAKGRRQDALNRVQGLQYGAANEGVDTARNDAAGAAGGFKSFLGSLVQRNLETTGANKPRALLPAVNGTTGQGFNLPGNAGSMFKPTPPIDWQAALDLSRPMRGARVF